MLTKMKVSTGFVLRDHFNTRTYDLDLCEDQLNMHCFWYRDDNGSVTNVFLWLLIIVELHRVWTE